jgi:hypothetical protein
MSLVCRLWRKGIFAVASKSANARGFSWCSAHQLGRPLALQAAKRPEKRERAPGTFARTD